MDERRIVAVAAAVGLVAGLIGGFVGAKLGAPAAEPASPADSSSAAKSDEDPADGRSAPPVGGQKTGVGAPSNPKVSSRKVDLAKAAMKRARKEDRVVLRALDYMLGLSMEDRDYLSWALESKRADDYHRLTGDAEPSRRALLKSNARHRRWERTGYETSKTVERIKLRIVGDPTHVMPDKFIGGKRRPR